MSRRKQETPKHFNNDQRRHTENYSRSGVTAYNRTVHNGYIPPLDPPNYVAASDGDEAIGGQALPLPALGGNTQESRSYNLGGFSPTENRIALGSMIDNLVWQGNTELPQERSYVTQGNNEEDFQYYRAEQKRIVEIILRSVAKRSGINCDEQLIAEITDLIDTVYMGERNAQRNN